MPSKNFRVIIAGGSISGLALAIMLEKNGIDFLVLEAYPEIAPQVGASIALLPNSFRILDQIGCYEDMMKLTVITTHLNFRRPDGTLLTRIENIGNRKVQRHGYPNTFMERRYVIEVLYGHIQDKSKVLTQKRIMTINITEFGVRVVTKDGSTYEGDIIIGADGVNSTVRKEMERNANERQAGLILESAKTVPATYACVFGISKGVKGLEPGIVEIALNKQSTLLVGDGKEDHTYWGLMVNMGQKVYGSSIPRFTEEQEEELAKNHWNDQINLDVKFSDLYTHRVASSYSPLAEFVHKTWYFGRIMTIGDACHKMHIMTGQGGNSAIETAAALTNGLVRMLKFPPGGEDVSQANISAVFDAVQNLRLPRAWTFVKAAHELQRLYALETPLLTASAYYMMPRLHDEDVHNVWYDAYVDGVSLDMFDIPVKPREVPFWDELLRRPTTRGWFVAPLVICFNLLAYLALRFRYYTAIANGKLPLISGALRQGSLMVSTIPPWKVFAGYPAIDQGSILPNREHQLQLVYFLALLLPLIAIFTIEGYRRRNSRTLLWSPSLWVILYQILGISALAPLYGVASIVTSRKIQYYSPPSRAVRTAISQALLPTLVVGYIIPILLVFYGITVISQSMIIFWQLTPIYVVILAELVARIRNWLQPKTPVDDVRSEFENSDLPYLQMVYGAIFLISAWLHVATVIICNFSSSLSLSRIFIPQEFFAPTHTIMNDMFTFFQTNLLLCAATLLLWCVTSIWDLYRVGISNVQVFKGSIALIAGYLIVGPGATVAALWHWWEGIMAKTNFGRRRPL